MFIAELFFGGCISKVINDGKDYSWTKIKSVINDRNDRNFSTRIYRVIEKALVKITDKKIKGKDILYEAIEKIFIEFRDHGSNIESVKCGLGMFNSNVTVERCENFLEKFYEGICQDGDLHEVIGLILQEKGIDINQKELRQLNKTVEYGFDQLNRKVDKIDEKIIINNNEDILQNREPVKSRTQEYADKWEANMFLNDFDEWDENAGVNVKLNDVYIDEHLPHFIFGHNKKESDNLAILLSKYIIKTNESKMLLILGQPGIGKSTLITWITVNFADRINDILIYRFASDLRNVDWKDGRISNRVLEELRLNHYDLKGKILILDGFDEVSIDANRRRDILDSLYIDLISSKYLNSFSLIITCRENYVPRSAILKCKYITIQPWDEIQIKSFCNVFQKKTRNNISESTIKKLIESRDILGIPLILYMVLALNISIEKEGSIVDIYDKIFSLEENSIYDRFIYEEPHRIGKIKKQIHQVSRNIAIWMFENKAVEAYIPYEKYERFCDNVMWEDEQNSEYTKQDVLIGNYFKQIKYCEGIESEKIYFIHRSIYEYFVVETIFSSIENSMRELTEESQDKFAGKIAFYLKQGLITNTIGEYLQYKLLKFYTKLDAKRKDFFYQWWEESVEKMMDNGMFYYTGGYIQEYKSIIDKETICFLNLITILRCLLKVSTKEYIFESVNKEQLEKYIRFRLVTCRIEERYGVRKFNLSRISLVGINLSGADLRFADLQGVNLKGANLREANLSEKNLRGANLQGADLQGANLQGTDLRMAEVKGMDLRGANIQDAVFDEKQVSYLRKYYNLYSSKVFIFNGNEVVSFKNYCSQIKESSDVNILRSYD